MVGIVDSLRGSIVALLTPMRVDMKIDFVVLEHMIDFHATAGTRAIVVASTTGESPTLSFEEHVLLYRSAVEYADGRLPVIAGVGSPSTSVACDLATEAQHASVDAVLCVTPYYNRPSPFGLRRHFCSVADAIDIPVILYDAPQRTGTQVPERLVTELSYHRNIIGLKDASGDLSRAKRLLETVSRGFRLFSGDDCTALDFMRLGGAGVVSVAANVAPSAVREMCDFVRVGALDEAARMNEALSPLVGLLLADTNPIPAKWVASKLGLMQNVLRPPLELSPSVLQFLSSSGALGATLPLLGV